MKNILICDDDKEIVKAIQIYLKDNDYKFFTCYRGNKAVEIVNSEKIDLIIIDIMMPGEDGIKTVIKIREKHTIPIIFLSAKSEDEDKILGLNIGADDYITKPFNPLELKARVNALLKRSDINNSTQNSDFLKCGGLVLDKTNRIITIDGNDINATPIEFSLLEFFLKNQGKVLTSDEIYKTVWKQENAYNIENTIAVHIKHLRDKIEVDTKNPKYIKVIWGVGYKLEKQ